MAIDPITTRVYSNFLNGSLSHNTELRKALREYGYALRSAM